jgi:hypothetical protein
MRNPFSPSALAKAARDLEEARCALIDAEWQVAHWQARRDALQRHTKTLARTLAELTAEQAERNARRNESDES